MDEEVVKSTITIKNVYKSKIQIIQLIYYVDKFF